jgi:adenosylhomocysteine nucleosidase
MIEAPRGRQLLRRWGLADNTVQLGIVVGLAAEARIARTLGEVAIGGGCPEGATVAAEGLVARGAVALLSFGVAGGLHPSLRPGDIAVPVAVLHGGDRYLTNETLCRALGGPTIELLLAGSTVVADTEAKQFLAARTGASAVDLESGAVARVAHRHGLPFAVLRVVCDPVHRSLPPVAVAAIGRAGAIRPLSVLGSIVACPSQIPALLRLALDAALARRALVRARRDLPWHLYGIASP